MIPVSDDKYIQPIKRGVSPSELIKALGVPAGNATVEWSAEDEERARRDNMDIQWMTEVGHTMHCAQRLIWGDGQCECGLESW